MQCIWCGSQGGFANELIIHRVGDEGVIECQWCMAQRNSEAKVIENETKSVKRHIFVDDLENEYLVTTWGNGETRLAVRQFGARTWSAHLKAKE